MTYTFSFICFSVTEIFHSELSLTSKDGNIAEKLMAPASALYWQDPGAGVGGQQLSLTWPATEVKEGTMNMHSLVWGVVPTTEGCGGSAWLNS